MSRPSKFTHTDGWHSTNSIYPLSFLQAFCFVFRCVLSRNTSNSDKSEWTCVHDIQDLPVVSSPTVVPRKRPRLEDNEGDGAEPSASYQASSSSSSSSSEQSDEETSNAAASTPSPSASARGPQVEVRITAPLQWGSRPGEGAGFHVRLESAEGDDEPSDNLEIRIPSEEVLEALESIRQAQAAGDDQQFAIRHRAHRRYLTRIFFVNSSRRNEIDSL